MVYRELAGAGAGVPTLLGDSYDELVGRSRARGAVLPAGPADARVSVVIPCYNYGRYLETCIGSVLSQEGVQVDVLVIDDASTDGSADTARELARQDTRITVLVHEVNRGHIATYNEGLALATGDFTVLLSADDLLVPGALARSTAVFSVYPDVGIVYGRAVYFTESDGLPSPRFTSGRHVVWSGVEWAESRCRIGRVGIVSPEVVVRTEVQHAVGGYRTDLPHSGDSEMWLRFAMRADVAYVDADHAYYRVHAASMSKSQFSSALADARERTRAYESAFTGDGVTASEASRLQELAMRGVAAEVLWAVCRAFDRGDADAQGVEQLVDFATEIYPAATKLPEYWRLRLRRAVGTRRASSMAPLWLPDLIVHRVRLLREHFGPNWWWHIRS